MRFVFTLIAALAIGCTDPPAEPMNPPQPMSGPDGGAGGTDDAGPDGGDVDVARPPDPRCAAPGQPLRRLTRAQYQNTLTDLLAHTVGYAPGGDVFWWLPEVFDALPPDEPTGDVGEPRGGFRRLDQVVYDEHVDQHARIAHTIGAELAQPWYAQQLLDGCDPDAPACLTDLIARFGQLVYRRPLEDDDMAFYAGIYATADDPTAGLHALFAALLTSPYFLYQVEPHGPTVDDAADIVALDGWSVANRLSYHFWQSMPDATLFAAAADGSLLTEDGFAEQVERLYADARVERALRAFFTEWLRADEVPDPTQFRGTPVFDAFSGGEEHVPNDLRQWAIDELADLGVYYAATAPGSFAELFSSDLVFARHAPLATLYGAEPWQGGAPQPMPDPERAGVLTRAAMLFSGSANTRPIIKGVRIREAILCDRLSPPPPDAMVREPDLAEDATSREVVETLTEVPESSCAGCHLTQINPLGFATENFDALGRVRTEQRLFDTRGQQIGARPVRTEAAPNVVWGDETVAADAVDLEAIILDSGRAHACFARQYFRFTTGRVEHASDGAVIDDLTARLRADDPLPSVLTAIALRPEFRQRRTCVDAEE